MLTATLDLSELPALRARVESALGSGCARIVAAAAKEGAEEARRVHRYVDRTGDLTRSIRGGLTLAILGAGGSAEGEIVADAKYASYVENGTRPHDIWPKEGGGFVGPLRSGQSRRSKTDIGTHRVALRWTSADGSVHFARMVHHKGGRAFPFMGPAYLRAQSVMWAEGERVLDEIVRREGA